MSTPSSSGADDTLGPGTGGLPNGTLLTFLAGLLIVVGTGAVVGPLTDSYVAVAFAAYFLTTVYDLVVDRLGYREALLERVRAADDATSRE
ncbi:MAG: hypothetical protein ABEH47_01460 [Haloferacaceae archaeon]